MTEETKKCVQAQEEYCKRKGYPMFAPRDGICYRCGKNIFDFISLEKAGQFHITGCPACPKSFCD